MESINIYIDGACSNNGKKDARAGYGVYFGENDQRNESGLVDGKQSNNTGELTAFIRCMNIIQDDQYKNTKINIYTDSEYVIKCVTTYGDKLEANGWNSKKEIPNIELVKQAYELYKNHKIALHYIKAHTTNSDIHSLGNAGADRLANEAANISGGIKKQYVKLDIPFSNKEKAKKLGAKWDINKKCWYIDSENLTDELVALQIDTTTDKIYLNVPFAQKDYVKTLGAKWDSGVKKWYYINNNISEDKKDKLNKFI